MKILLLSWGIPTVKRPQYGCFAMDQAVALKQAGHDVGILSINSLVGKEWKRPGMHHWTQNGVECFELFGLPIGIVERFLKKSWSHSILKWGAKLAYKKAIEIFGVPDIVHAHFVQMMVAGTAIKEQYPIVLVGTEHWSQLSVPEVSREVINLGRYAYPMVDRLICVSKKLKDRVKEYFNKDSEVIHNLFNTGLLKPAIKNTDNPVYTIAAVGSLIPRKGFDILIKAFAESSLSDKPVILNIFGKGPIREDLQNLIDGYGMQKHIFLRGQKAKEELYEELRHSDLFVLSSRIENFSVAMIEATGNGLPAVATLCGGIEEYPIRNVIKIPTENIEAMRKALEQSYAQRKDVDREAIQRETIKIFSPEAIIPMVEKVYEDVLKGR